MYKMKCGYAELYVRLHLHPRPGSLLSIIFERSSIPGREIPKQIVSSIIGTIIEVESIAISIILKLVPSTLALLMAVSTHLPYKILPLGPCYFLGDLFQFIQLAFPPRLCLFIASPVQQRIGLVDVVEPSPFEAEEIETTTPFTPNFVLVFNTVDIRFCMHEEGFLLRVCHGKLKPKGNGKKGYGFRNGIGMKGGVLYGEVEEDEEKEQIGGVLGQWRLSGTRYLKVIGIPSQVGKTRVDGSSQEGRWCGQSTYD
ncbi:hypothetical protein V6N13_000412 [Hibiscus sabdariffa]